MMVELLLISALLCMSAAACYCMYRVNRGAVEIEKRITEMLEERS